MKKIAISLGILLIVVFTLTGCGETSPSVGVGSEATICAPDIETVYLAVDKDSFDACVAEDYIGMAQLEMLGKVFAVPNGTRVLVIDSDFACREVRILEGDSFGISGWLSYEWLE